jgi:SAM-dependent methyltransferase
MKLIGQLRGKFVRSVVRHGVLGTVAHIASWPLRALHRLRPRVRTGRAAVAEQSARFDREFGVDTDGQLGIASLDIVGGNRDHGEFYLGSDPTLVREALAALPIAYEDFAFVDYGSGKGRVLLLASEFPFKFIVGVEFAAELHRICQANLKNHRNPACLCHDIRPVHQDAVTFDLPEEPLVLYFFNPFDLVIFHAVVNRLGASLRHHPRPAWIVYNNPKDRHSLDSSPFLEEVSSTPGYSIYRSR